MKGDERVATRVVDEVMCDGVGREGVSGAEPGVGITGSIVNAGGRRMAHRKIERDKRVAPYAINEMVGSGSVAKGIEVAINPTERIA